MAKALEELAQVRERFAAGALSYSQVRAICRVATPAIEELLLEWAAASTASQLERITRAYRRTAETAAADEQVRHQGRYLRFTYDDDGSLVGSFRLPPDSGAVLAAAIAAATEHASVEEADADGARDPFSAVQADALVELVRAGHATGQSEEVVCDDDRTFLVTIVTEPAALTGGVAETDGTVEGEGRLCHIEDGPGLADETARRIACDAATCTITEAPDGTVLDVGRRTRRINRRLRRALRRRDRQCQFPACELRGRHAHHIQHWIDGGPTNLTNLVSLCAHHHHRVHEGGYCIRRLEAGGYEFIHPRGWALPAACPPPSPELSHVDWAEPAAYRDGWDGTRLDLHMTTAGLMETDEMARRDSAESSEPTGAVDQERGPVAAAAAKWPTAAGTTTTISP